MLEEERVLELRNVGRYITKAETGDPDLGPLQLLPGTWSNKPDFRGRGWNMIALPFPAGPFRYRLLMNQYNETLKFMVADKGVPNRGLTPDASGNADQIIVALDYEQSIEQIAVDDFPATDESIRGVTPKPIHHEPGLFLHMTNKVNDQFDVARLGTVPHGDSLLALGSSDLREGAIEIPQISGLPIGLPTGATVDTVVDPDNPSYLDPYKHFHHNPFKGILGPGFSGFEPVDPLNLLRGAMTGFNVRHTMVLDFDTTVQSGGILNIPFIVAEANATEMRSIFWIHELNELGADGRPRLIMQYAQIVMLDFFPRRDGVEGLIKWPHVSINMMEKISEDAVPLADIVKVSARAFAPRSIV
ncbi:MAG: hypothetical protein KL863_09550 [Rhizobium sp.]|nr:hypothetical protein [Rhizobium sp.]